MVKRAAGLISLVLLGSVPAHANRGEIVAVLTEWQPDIRQSGRINTVAVNPADPDEVFAASESGGVFRSGDSGATWRHIDALPVWGMRDIAFDPEMANVIITTSGKDFSDTGGIWTSFDGGDTWSSAAWTGSDCRDGYGISFPPGGGPLYVATGCGIGVSDDHGASFRLVPLTSGFPLAVVALPGGGGVAAGSGSIWRTTDGGASWTLSARGPVRGINSFHALTAGGALVWLADDTTRGLFASSDGGATWAPFVLGPPGGRDGCGGLGFVKVVPGGPFGVQIYFSNTCRIFLFPDFSLFPFLWADIGIPHDDPHDLFLDASGNPRFAMGDGGLYRLGSGGWEYAGGARRLGALQLYEIAGQAISTDRHDLYTGTQDNDLWSSRDLGVSWPYSQSAEGFSFAMDALVLREEDSQINYKRCAACVSKISGPNFSGEGDWTLQGTDPVIGFTGFPSLRVQAVGPAGRAPRELMSTFDLGRTWQPASRDLGRDYSMLPKVSRLSFDPILYQAYVSGTDGAGHVQFKLARLRGYVTGTGAMRFPAMTGFGSLGTFPGQYVWYHPWAVDPVDPMHLIATDVGTGTGSMMRSLDGGQTWTAMTGLTSLVTRGGTRAFVLDEGDKPYSLVTAVGFNDLEPDLVLAGAFDGGLYISGDRGEHWQDIPGSAQVPSATGFHWVGDNLAFVSTFGRGLWKIDLSFRMPTIDLARLCPGRCDFRPIGQHVAFDRAVLILSGRITDASSSGGSMSGMAMSANATALLFSDVEGDSLAALERRAGPGKFDGLPEVRDLADKGVVIRGFTFAGNEVAGVITSDSEAPHPPAKPFLPFEDMGSLIPPTQGQPYLSVGTGANHRGMPVLAADERVFLSGSGFKRGPVELTLDGERAPRHKVEAKKDGTFALTLRLRRSGLGFGLHTIAAVQRVSPNVVLRAAGSFAVKAVDLEQ